MPDKIYRYGLKVSYDGTGFTGFARHGISKSGIIEVIEKALIEFLGTEIKLRGASRTDSGVSALAQWLDFDFPGKLPEKAFVLGLKPLLIPTIQIEKVITKEDFSCRHHSSGKWYRYHIWTGRNRPPVSIRKWCYHAPLENDNLCQMNEILNELVGEHDFSSFRSAHCGAAHAFRRLEEVKVSRSLVRPELIYLDIWGNAFVMHQVRIIAGTMIDILNASLKNTMFEILLAKDRKVAGQTLPGYGLCLMHMYFPFMEKHAGNRIWI